MAQSRILGSQLFRRAQKIQNEFPQKSDQVRHGLRSWSDSISRHKSVRIRFSEGTGLLTFFWVVTLLNHRQWSWAIAGMLMMMALVPISLATH
jgi:hypothetical protein